MIVKFIFLSFFIHEVFLSTQAGRVPFCKFHLGDRPIPVTFKRAIAALSLWQKARLAWGLCFLSDPIRYKFILVTLCHTTQYWDSLSKYLSLYTALFILHCYTVRPYSTYPKMCILLNCRGKVSHAK